MLGETKRMPGLSMGYGPCVEQMFAPGLREPKTKTAGAPVGGELNLQAATDLEGSNANSSDQQQQ